MPEQAVEPVAVDDDVGVQKHHVLAGRALQAAVAGPHEAKILRVDAVGEQAACGELGERRAQARLGAAIVDDEEGERRGLRRAQHRVDRP